MVPSFQQTTSGLPPAKRFAYWQDAILPSTEMFLRTERDGFACERMVSLLPRGMMITTTATPFHVERRRLHISRDHLDFVVLSMLLAGTATQEQMGRSTVAHAGDIAICDVGRPLATGGTEPYREARLYIDRKVFESRVAPAAAVAGLVLPRDRPGAAMFGRHLAAYSEATPKLSVAEADSAMDGLLHLLAGLVADLRADNAWHRGAGEDLPPTSVRALADDYIRQRLTDPGLDVAALLRDLGISRTKLYAAFADDGGVRAAIRDARLERVRAALAAPASRGRKIEEVARRYGFADYPSFSRAFRRRFGMWPSECRA